MREVKFRCWGKDGGEDADGEWTMSNPFGINEVARAFDCGYFAGYEMDEVNPIQDGAVIMQFTGLLDKNGKENYESDLISFKTKKGENIYEVIWHQDRGGWFGKPIRIKDYAPFYKNPQDYEIIGNIYEHPNLLTS